MKFPDALHYANNAKLLFYFRLLLDDKWVVKANSCYYANGNDSYCSPTRVDSLAPHYANSSYFAYIYIYIYIKPKWWEYPNIKSVVWMESVLSDIFPFVLDDLPAS